jgi:hypothetical protein
MGRVLFVSAVAIVLLVAAGPGVPDGSVPGGGVLAGNVPDRDVPDGSVLDGSTADGSRPEGGMLDGSVPDRDIPDGSDEAPEKVSVKVGKSVELRLGFVCIEWVCDDKSIARVEDGGDHLKLKGLAEGKTLCGFWKEKSPRPHRLFEVTVTADKPPPKR